MVPIDGGHPGWVYANRTKLLLKNTDEHGEFRQYLRTSRMGSAIFGPDGRTIADTLSQAEDMVVATIRMASFRRTHRLPDVFMPMYRHLYDAFPARLEPGGYSKSIPDTLESANALWKKKVKW